MANHQKHMQRRLQSLSDLRPKQYQGSLKPRYQERIWINDYQHKLYRTALLGLKAFTKAELFKMTAVAKEKIILFYERAQIVLNRWKQHIMNDMFEQLCSIDCSEFGFNPFKKVFDDTVIGVKKFGKAVDDTFECTLTFAQLKITREQVIQKLIMEKILPEDFYKLEKA